MAAALLLFPLLGQPRRARLRQLWSRGLIKALGMRLEIRGAPPPPGSLIVANHVSWVDIFAINALTPAAFISKAEVREWPIIGWLAARNDTVFLRRGSRGHARIVNAEIEALMAAGEPVALFPEGTTTDGSHLLHFHAALLQPAINAARPIAPVAIRYVDAGGDPSIAAAYIGDMSLWQSMQAIVTARGLGVRLTGCAAVETGGMERKGLCHRVRATILDALELSVQATATTTTSPD